MSMDTNPIALKVRVLSYVPGSFKNPAGETITYNHALVRFDGIVLKLTAKDDLSQYVDKDITLALEVRAGQKMEPKFSIVGVQA